MSSRGLLGLLAVIGLLALASCGDRSGAAGADGGDPANLSRSRDAGGEGGMGSPDAGIDELAVPPPPNEELLGRMRHLLEAVAQNNAELAGDVLFPRDGYAAARDVADPQKAWDKRVAGLFRRSVERTHKRTKGIDGAKFVGFELGHGPAQLTPKKHDFKKPLWRVKHSKLTFTIEGKVRQLEIAELTAWRGAWYVTRLR